MLDLVMRFGKGYMECVRQLPTLLPRRAEQLPQEAKPALTILPVIVLLVLGVSLWLHDGQLLELAKGVSVESYGLVMDLLLFGVLILIFDTIREKRRERQRQFDLIDDFRPWQAEEAGVRIMGAVTRLTEELDVPLKEISLEGCFLAIDMKNRDMRDSLLINSFMEGGVFTEARFDDARLMNAQMSKGRFSYASFVGADLHKAKLKGAEFDHAVCTGAVMTKVQLTDVSCKGTIFDGVDFSGVWGHDYDRLKEAKSFKGATYTVTDPVFLQLHKDFENKF